MGILPFGKLHLNEKGHFALLVSFYFPFPRSRRVKVRGEKENTCFSMAYVKR
jgi:hypothetical protein